MSQSIPLRKDVPLAQTWDATTVFADDAAWEAAIADCQSQMQAVAQLKGRLAESASLLASALEQVANLWVLAMKVYMYAEMFHTVDTADSAGTVKSGRAQGLMGQVTAVASFVDPEILAIAPAVLQKWQTEEPRLAGYEHHFARIEWLRPHTRSAEVEQVMGLARDAMQTAASIHSIFVNADLNFPPVLTAGGESPLSPAYMNRYYTSPDRAARRQAWTQYADEYLAHKNGFATCMATGIKQDVFRARVRGYGSSLEAAAHRNYLPTAVFHNTIETFKKHLPLWHKYWRVRREALGVDSLHPYDMLAPLTAVQPQVPYAQAFDWIVEGLRPLGREYLEAMKQGVLQERWVDIYPNKNKQGGAFSAGTYGTPPFLFLNHSDDLFGLSTFAHELGHSMHSYFTNKYQPERYSNYTIFVAEVASNFNQALVRDYLYHQNSDPQFQIALIEEAMSNFHRYFFIMPTLARFELEIHERVERGEGLTAESLINLMADLFGEGFGDEVVMDRERVGITWAQFPSHLYENFYVYQYATGIAGAHALAQAIWDGRPNAVENYLGFLKAGSSAFPLDVLRQAGVDMTTPEPMEKAFGVLATWVDRLEALTKK